MAYNTQHFLAIFPLANFLFFRMKSPRRRLSDTWVCAKAHHCIKVRLATGADSRVRVRVMARTRVWVRVMARTRVRVAVRVRVRVRVAPGLSAS